MDVFLSHDWPVGITAHGDVAGLLRRKPFFRADIEKGELGSPPAMDLLLRLKPKWWFSAHLHCRFEASVVHDHGDNLDNSLGETQGKVLIFTGGSSSNFVACQQSVADQQKLPADTRFSPSGQARGDNPNEIIIDDDLDMSGETPSAPAVDPAPVASTSRGPPSESEAHPSLNPDEIVLEDEIEDVAPPPRMPEVTRFLALDKCLPQRQYLEVRVDF